MPVESRMSKITVCKERRKLSVSLDDFQRNIRSMVTLFLQFSMLEIFLFCGFLDSSAMKSAAALTLPNPMD